MHLQLLRFLSRKLIEERKDCLVFVSPRRANVIGITNGDYNRKKHGQFFDQLPSTNYGLR